MPNEYLKTVDRLEPSIHPIDATSGWASIAISLRRIADAMEVTDGIKPIGPVVDPTNLPELRSATPAGEAAIETTGGTRQESVVCYNGPMAASSVPTAWVVGQLLTDAGASVEYATTGHVRQIIITGRETAMFDPPITIEFPLAPAFRRRSVAGAVLSPDSVETLQSLLDGFFYDSDAADAIITRMAEKGMSGPLVRVEQLLADIGLWPGKGTADGG